jgi:hypothetical protein
VKPYERSILVIIADALSAGGPAPSNQDICTALGWKSVASASGAVSALDRYGFINIARLGRARSIIVTPEGWEVLKREPVAPDLGPKYPIPDDFAAQCCLERREDLALRYSVPLTRIDYWIARLSLEERVARRAAMARIAGDQQRKAQQASVQAYADRRDLRLQVEALAPLANRDIHAIIARETARREAANAARPDPYAGLTGFDRSMAIARDRGIQERPAFSAVQERTFGGISSVYDNAPGNG